MKRCEPVDGVRLFPVHFGAVFYLDWIGPFDNGPNTSRTPFDKVNGLNANLFDPSCSANFANGLFLILL